MSKLRVFVSHGAKTPEEIAVRNRLVQAIENAGCEVLMDRITLVSGARWRPEIYSWMLLAHVGIVLLSPSAKRSRWVPREAMILRWRKEMDSAFSLHLVLAPGFGIPDLNQGAYRDLGLSDINASSSDDLTSLLHELSNATSLPEDLIPRRIREVLLPVYSQLDEGRKQRASQFVPFQLSSWATELKQLDLFAVQLAHYGLREAPPRGLDKPTYPGVKALSAIKDAIGQELGQRLLEIMAPSWVDCAAAARVLAEAKRERQDRRVLVLTAAESLSAEHYVTRGWSQDWDFIPYCLSLAELKPESKPTRLEDLRAALFETIRPVLRQPSQGDSKVVDELARKNLMGTPYFIYVVDNGRQSVSLEDLSLLQRDQPDAIYLWLCCKRPNLLPNCCLLRPVLRSSVERAGLSAYDNAYTIIHRP